MSVASLCVGVGTGGGPEGGTQQIEVLSQSFLNLNDIIRAATFAKNLSQIRWCTGLVCQSAFGQD